MSHKCIDQSHSHCLRLSYVYQIIVVYLVACVANVEHKHLQDPLPTKIMNTNYNTDLNDCGLFNISSKHTL